MLVHVGSHRHDPGGEVREKMDDGFAYSLSCRDAGKCFRLTVPLGDGAGIVHPYQYGGHRVDDVGEVVLETVDLGSGPFSLRDIDRGAYDSNDIARVIQDRVPDRLSMFDRSTGQHDPELSRDIHFFSERLLEVSLH